MLKLVQIAIKRSLIEFFLQVHSISFSSVPAI